MHPSPSRTLKGSSSGSRLHGSASASGLGLPLAQQRTLGNPQSHASLAAILQDQQAHQQQRAMAVSASTPALHNRTAVSGTHATSSAARSMAILPPMGARTQGQTGMLPSSGLEHELDGMSPGVSAEEDEDAGVAASMSAALLATGTDLNLADGIDQLAANLQKLVPNMTLRSVKYKQQVQSLLSAIRLRANHAHAENKARKAALDAALASQRAAEASEHRYRSSVHNLQLDQWGSLDTLKQDIRALEQEIVERGRLSVEDHESMSQGLGHGIEVMDGTWDGAASGILADTQMVRQRTSKLVHLKFKRLEQLIYLLKRQLGGLENYPHQKSIDARFGGLDQLLQHVDNLEAENMRLEARLEGQAMRYKEDVLLRVRDLTTCPPAFLHLLIVSLQQTLQSYMRAMEVAGLGKDWVNHRHPLHNAMRAWQAEVDKEARRIEGPLANKRGSLGREGAALTAAAMTAVAAGVKPIPLVNGKLDVEELWRNMQGLSGSGGSSGAISGVSSNPPPMVASRRGSFSSQDGTISRRTSMKNMQVPGSAAAAAAANTDASAQLTAAFARIQSLESEMDLLQRELQAKTWMEKVLEREGVTPANANAAATEMSTRKQQEADDAAAAGSARPRRIVTGAERQGEEAKEAAGTPPQRLRLLLNDESVDETPSTVRRRTDADADADGPSSTAADDLSDPPSPTPSGGSGGGGGVSTVSKRLLRHLQSYANEVSRYRRSAAHFQQLHVAREQAMAAAERERAGVTRVLLYLLCKHPQLADANASMATSGGPNASASTGPASSRTRGMGSRKGSSAEMNGPGSGRSQTGSQHPSPSHVGKRGSLQGRMHGKPMFDL